MAQAVIEFVEVTKRFGSALAVDRLSFTIAPGELFTLLGPSGCGKTTTLRLVAGLEEPDEGEIFLNGIPIASPKRGIFLPPDRRQMGMVFQSYAIWPHLTVFENVAFPLRVRREPAPVIKKRVLEALELVGLQGLAERGATELSGGQQQRVALARALAYAPAILLLDEPLSNLDAKLREQMRFELCSLQRRLNLSVLYVTHDQDEAMAMSDRIAVINRGRLEQVGAAAELYETPASSFVGDFLGRTVMLQGTVKKNEKGAWIDLRNAGGRISPKNDRLDHFAEGDEVRILSRPEDIDLLPGGEVCANQIRAEVEMVAYLGDHLEYSVSVGGWSFVLAAGKKARYPVGAGIRLAFDPERITILPV